ncbi:MAG: GIY-YIG nuclease family protein, partial [Candidatus Kapaibacteriota bacterium]
MFYVYILYSPSHNRFYIGQTNNLNNRLFRHNSGQVLSTKHYRPWILIFSKQFDSRADALIEEKRLKAFKNPAFLLKE